MINYKNEKTINRDKFNILIKKKKNVVLHCDQKRTNKKNKFFCLKIIKQMKKFRNLYVKIQWPGRREQNYFRKAVDLCSSK